MALLSAIMVKVPLSSAMESGWHDGDGHQNAKNKRSLLIITQSEYSVALEAGINMPRTKERYVAM